MKPTGKQRVTLRKLDRRIKRAVKAADMAKTPAQQAAAEAEGMKAAGKADNLLRVLRSA